MGCELMTPGTLLLGNAGQWFECGREHGSGDRCVSFHCEPEYFEKIAMGAGLRRGKTEFETLRIPAVREVSGLVARACSGIEGGAEMSWEEFAVQLAARAVELANDVRPRNEEVAASTLARVTRSVRAIERQAEGELNLAALAREAGLSPYHFPRTFERLTGDDAAPVPETNAIAESGGEAGEGQDEGAGCCAGLRVWGCVEFQSSVSRGVRDESGKLSGGRTEEL